jgi:ubiquinone/menaquinone biosynthesis C-methylase UbiE
MTPDPTIPGAEGVPHEQFHDVYRAGKAAWCIGRPQPVVMACLERGWFDDGPILDAGCGTGENAVAIAKAHPTIQVLAIDAVPEALASAARSIDEANVSDQVTLNEVDLRQSLPPGPFAWILDAGVLHVFSDVDRGAYLTRVAASLQPGGSFVTIVFRDDETRPRGPRRLGGEELGTALSQAGLRVDSIEPCLYDSVVHDGGARSWLARAVRPASDAKT